MEASKAAGIYGIAPGFAVEIADDVQAYIQAELCGTPCWICLPPEARPDSWGHFKKARGAIVARALRAPRQRDDVGAALRLAC